MNRSVKLALDVLLGAVVPILVLSYLSEPLGAVPAYVASALIPVGWVLADLFFITKRFNFITGFLGLNAIVRGLLAFWFVDGVLYALKDTAGGILTVLVFGGSLLLGRPVIRAFAEQSLGPRTPEQEAALEGLFTERPVARSLVWGTAIFTAVNVATSAANFVLNLSVVTAPFGTAEFNGQVARVNAITRLAIGIPEFLVMGFAISLVYWTLYSRLPDATGESNFWELVELREAREGSVLPGAGMSGPPPGIPKRPRDV